MAFKREDENIPINFQPLSFCEAYQPHDKEGIEKEVLDLQDALNTKVENFYDLAHRVQKTIWYFFNIGSKSNSRIKECKEITIIRNQILNHSRDHPPRNVTYTFGFGSGGPVLSPMMLEGAKIRDPGLSYNVTAFDDYVTHIFETFTKKAD